MGTLINKNTLKPKTTGLGTFGGVFTPSILTILGVIMYLRFGWVVGNVGLTGTLIIVTLATSITFLTGLSIASIATDQKVKTGGAYYMISRSLGIESGGAIGISLYFAQALSVALYTVGFAESVVQVFPELDEKLLGIITTILVAALALGSAKAAIQAQYVIMVGIVISLICLFFGSPLEEAQIHQWGDIKPESHGFWTVFAVFFPAVTGIMAGVNMSGDLKNPKKSIPKGTFMAIAVGYVIYMILPVILVNRAGADSLINDPLIMRKISFWGDSILIGVWGATLSSAVGSMLGAPRVLQALAKDNILPKFLKWTSKGSGNDDTPRLGTIFTLGVVLLTVWIADLNLIAPILTMFFLTTYGVLNVAAGIERFLGSPSFRPTFRVHWVFSMVGAIACLAVMLLINTPATIAALLFVFLIFIWLKKRELNSSWGSIGRGVRMAILRANIMRLTEDLDSKNWRPNPIVLAGSPTKRWHLIEFANTFTHKQGILSVASVLSEGTMSTEQIQSMKTHIQEFMLKKGVNGLVKVMQAKDRFTGAANLVNAYGLGTLVPNTVILGESQSEKYRPDFCTMIQRFYDLQRNILIVHKAKDGATFGAKKRIDVWWGGLKGNGGLMMILAYLMSNNIDWRQAKVHIKMVVASDNAVPKAQENLTSILEEIRIKAETDVIASNGNSFDDILKESSARADLVFMGMAPPDENFENYYATIQERIKDMPTTILALAAQEVSFGKVLVKNSEEVDN
ncbi:MAG: amino acid permease [Flavobacteriales bacterium]|nr:amino acid permease [Flavobacteriales bacterium]